jgi:hypothetical protein
MRIVGVVVGAAAHAKTQRFRDPEVVCRREIVVVAVVDLERIKAVARVSRQPLVALHQPGVRQRRDAAGLVNPFEDLFRRCANT